MENVHMHLKTKRRMVNTELEPQKACIDALTQNSCDTLKMEILQDILYELYNAIVCFL